MLTRKKTIAIAINDFLVGGAQRLIAMQLKNLDPMKYDMHVLSLFEFPLRKDLYNEIPSYVHIHKIGMTHAYDVRAWVRIMKTLYRMRPVVVFSHLFLSNAFMRILKPLFGYKVITVEHNTYIDKKGWQVRFDRLLAPISSKIIAVSNEVKNFTIEQQRCPRDKVVVIPNGIDRQPLISYGNTTSKNALRTAFGLSEKDTIFITVGRLTHQKNQKLLIESFATHIQTYPESILIVAGEGALHKDLAARAQSCGINEKVIFLGSVENLHQYYLVSDFMVSTSLIEGMSMAYLEALTCGLPIIATITGGTKDIIDDGINGLLIYEHTVHAVCDTMARALTIDYGTLSINALKKSELFDIKQNVIAYEHYI